MLITTKGTTITRRNGYKLVEYSCGDHEESIYYIYKGSDCLDMFYEIPKKAHEKAVIKFNEYVIDYMKG